MLNRRRCRRQRRWTWCLTFAALLPTGCASTSATRQAPSEGDSLFALARLDDILVRHTYRAFREDPYRRLAFGLRLERLPGSLRERRRDEARYAREVQRALENIRYDALSQDNYLSLHAVHWELGNEAEAPIYRVLDFAPVVPAASPLPAIARALSQHPIDSVPDVTRYLLLLDNLAVFFPEVRAALAQQAAAGITLPAVTLDSVTAFVRSFRQESAESPFRLAEDRLTRIDSVSRGVVLATLSHKIDAEINPAIDTLLTYLTGAYAARMDTSRVLMIGLGRYAGGREYYRYLIRRHTSLDVAPEDLYRFGVREVARISAAMTGIRRKLAFSGSDSAFRASLRQAPRFRIASPNDFEQRVLAVTARLQDSLRVRLGIEMKQGLVLAPVPSAPFAGARSIVHREADEIDRRFRLEYASDRIESLPGYVVPALVAREIIPGRHLMLSAVRANDSIAPIRQLMRIAGFLDGWAEYAAGLVGELGLFADEYEAYGALMLELESAARLVADVGLHHFEWPYPEAVRYLRGYSVDPSTAGSDVLRIAIAEPARAIAAKAGAREFAGQRAWVKRQWSDSGAFDDGSLVREVLRVGVLPLPVLSRHLAWWTTRNRRTKQGARE